jgi:hypothetical protein
VEQGNKENKIDQKPISIAHRAHRVKAVPPALMVPIIDVLILKKLNTQIEKRCSKIFTVATNKEEEKTLKN